jgi:hypothetical protein
MANNGRPNDEKWQDLARQIQEENDPDKVVELAQQLIAKLDDARLEKDSPDRT